MNKPDENQVICGKRYRHYKGKEYQVLHVAKHSETLEEMVVYQALYEEQQIWVRPITMFMERVNVKGTWVPRFKAVE